MFSRISEIQIKFCDRVHVFSFKVQINRAEGTLDDKR
jgi:hypothetical protein